MNDEIGVLDEIGHGREDQGMKDSFHERLKNLEQVRDVHNQVIHQPQHLCFVWAAMVGYQPPNNSTYIVLFNKEI